MGSPAAGRGETQRGTEEQEEGWSPGARPYLELRAPQLRALCTAAALRRCRKQETPGSGVRWFWGLPGRDTCGSPGRVRSGGSSREVSASRRGSESGVQPGGT